MTTTSFEGLTAGCAVHCLPAMTDQPSDGHQGAVMVPWTPERASGRQRRSRRHPALRRWRDELHAGLRTITDFDDLWRAASREMSAQEYSANGLPMIADAYQEDARRIVRRAARKQAT